MSRRQTEQLAFLTNSIASVQRQISELIDVTCRTTEWMHAQQARSVDIDKNPRVLACEHRRLTVSLGLFRSKSVVSDWHLPKVAGFASSSSNRRLPQSHTPSESAGISQPPRKRQKPSSSPAQKAPEEWYQQNEEFLRRFLPCAVCQQLLLANSGKRFRHTTDNLLAVRKSSEVLHLFLTRKMPECPLWTTFLGSRCPFSRLSWSAVHLFSKSTKKQSSLASPLNSWRSFLRPHLPPVGRRHLITHVPWR